MEYPAWIANLFYKVSDFFTAIIPQKTPALEQFKRAKMIAHRGVHQKGVINENTLAAFNGALIARVWGIELDIRWTKDGEPVVHHDANTLRVFAKEIMIHEVTLAELQAAIPEIPTLQQVVSEFGKKLTLLIELKTENYLDIEKCKIRLQEILAPLIPGKDFYLISMDFALLEQMNGYASDICFPIGQVNMHTVNDLALSKNYAGILGHYVFTRKKYVVAQLQNAKQVGTGFVESRNCLFRELNRGVTLFSSNNAAALQAIVEKHLALAQN